MRYGRLLTRLYNTPLLISQAKLDIITQNVTIKLLANEDIQSLDQSVNEELWKKYLLAKKAELESPVIKVFDTLVSKNGAGDSGSTSYESILNDIKLAIDMGHKKLVFYVGSLGGEAGGLFGLTNFIHSLPYKYGIETIGFTDDYATSAAYAILAATQKAYATSTAEIGSIAAVASLIDVTEADKEAGIKYKVLRSKDKKALGNPHEGFSEEAIAKVSQSLEILDIAFNEAISKYRPNLSIEDIKSLEGNTFFGEKALSLGLIDGVVDSIDVVLSTSKTKPLTIKGKSTMTLEEAMAENIRLTSEVQTLKASQSLEVAKAKKEEQDRVLGILDAQKTFSLATDAAVKCIKTNMSLDATVSMFEMVKEQVQLANPVNTVAGLSAGVAANTIPTAKTGSEEEAYLNNFMSAVDAAIKKPQLILR